MPLTSSLIETAAKGWKVHFGSDGGVTGLTVAAGLLSPSGVATRRGQAARLWAREEGERQRSLCLK